MKRLLYLFVLCCFVACGKDDNGDNPRPTSVDKITISKQVIEVDFEPNIYSVSVTSPYDWDAFSECDWIEVVSKQGVAGVTELSFNVMTRNEEFEKRMGSIVVTNGEHNLVAELYVTQKKFEPTEITIDSNTLIFSADGGEQNIAVTANFAHEATTEADWLQITKNETGYVVSVPIYMEVEERTAEVVVFSDKYNVSKSITIAQRAFEPILEVKGGSLLEFVYTGGVQSISVESNFEYDITLSAEWLTVNKTTSGITVNVSYNSSNARTANISIYGVKYDLGGKVIVVKQEAWEPVSEEYAVDLGLSVKWASCNVGASRPEDYGSYFAWGEISSKDSYYDHNCTTYGVNIGDISGNSAYDVVVVNWGGSWRMPTSEEMQELVNDCTWEWTSVNNVNGMRVTGLNGNSIFLPAAGYRYGTSSYGVGSYSNYWCSAPDGDSDFGAYNLYFSNDSYDWYWSYRYYGHSVRPILE